MELRTEKKTIRGKEYTFQEMPARAFLQLKKRAEDKNANPIYDLLYDGILKNIVIEPRVSIEDFGTAELEELVNAAFDFQLNG